MLALTVDLESSLLERMDGPKMIDAGKLWHRLYRGHFEFSELAADFRLAVKFKVALDRFSNVFQRFINSRTLGMAAGKPRTTDGNTILMLQQRYLKSSFHSESKGTPLTRSASMKQADPRQFCP